MTLQPACQNRLQPIQAMPKDLEATNIAADASQTSCTTMTPKQTALTRQDLSSIYLAQHELESSLITVTIYDLTI